MMCEELSARMAHPDLNALFNAVLPFAKLMLSEQGEFFPFGATMSPNGEITHVGARIEDDERPPAQSLIDVMAKSFQRQAANGQLRAETTPIPPPCLRAQGGLPPQGADERPRRGEKAEPAKNKSSEVVLSSFLSASSCFRPSPNLLSELPLRGRSARSAARAIALRRKSSPET